MNRPVELYYTSRGEGPALLILHGLYGSGNNWLRHARWLSERFRVILPDLRNHGRSPHAPEMNYPAMATDLLALMDRLELQQALVLGHSMGGKAAMTAALMAPERVRALVAADIAPVDYGREHDHDRIIEGLRDLPLARVDSRNEADRQLAARIETPMVRQFLLTNLDHENDGYRWRIPLDVLAQALPDIAGFPDLPGRYGGPTLLIHGEQSDYVTDDMAPVIRERFPRAEIAGLEGTGHWLHVERPDAFAERLTVFLSPFHNDVSEDDIG